MEDKKLSAEEMEREQFEAHMRLGGHSNPSKHPDGSYASSAMELWWQGWKARATLARHPQPECGEGLEVVAFRVSLPDEPELGTWLEEGAEEEPQTLHHEPLCRLSDAQRLLAERDAEIESLRVVGRLLHDSAQLLIAEDAQLRARVAELEAKLATPSYYWGDDENGAVESPEEWAEMQYGMTGEAFSSTTLRCAIELPEREFDSIEFDEEGSCISIRYVGEVARLNAKPAGEVES
ncbi:hypothetical protein ACF8C6_08855 [Pseudomonas sp. zbq_18]|uniref:hypothetical protein n=1 Tax=Pseudomonas sp. zbq_18 TaxID=3367251 RepID=UPI00370CF9EB